MPRTSSPQSRHMAQLRDIAKERKEALKAIEDKYADETKDLAKERDAIVGPAMKARDEAIAAAAVAYEEAAGPAIAKYQEDSQSFETARLERVKALEAEINAKIDASYKQYTETRG